MLRLSAWWKLKAWVGVAGGLVDCRDSVRGSCSNGEKFTQQVEERSVVCVLVHRSVCCGNGGKG